MSDNQIGRIIDANLDRAGEGLRVLEEVARFVLDNPALSARFKEMRHQLSLRDVQTKLAFLSARNASGDVGEAIKSSFQSSPRNLLQIATANARRAEEALRVLEEFAPSANLDSQVYAVARYQLYTLEKDILGQLARHNKRYQISGLYAVIDTTLTCGHNILDITTQTLSGGAKIIQLRDSITPKGKLLQLAREMKQLCSCHNALFVVSGHADIALATNADGLHIEQGDIPTAEVRCLAPIDKILGCSVDTPAEALKAQQDGADYIACDALFGISTQADTPPEHDTIKSIKKAVQLPLVVGVNSMQSITDITKAGADAVAVCMPALSAEKTTRELLETIDACLKVH
ncbi:MAG: thiamine phosphate synthase [Dehalococcoidia bacterium]|nr:thiamine phosphate synthase [Dehalococcoidia bacterium]